MKFRLYQRRMPRPQDFAISIEQAEQPGDGEIAAVPPHIDAGQGFANRCLVERQAPAQGARSD